jgi:hypothetical protein
MPSEPEIRRCRVCGKILESWKSPYCSDSCYASEGTEQPEQAEATPVEPAKPERKVKLCACGNAIRLWRYNECDECRAAASEPEQPTSVSDESPEPSKRRQPPNPMPDPPNSTAAATGQPENGGQYGTVRNIRCPKCGTPVNTRKGGAPTKATDELLAAILSDMTEYGMTEAQACARHGVRAETFSRWKNLPEHEGLRAHAEAIWIKTKLDRKRELADNKLDWKEPAWDLERRFKGQFGDPSKASIQINQQFNGNHLHTDQNDLEEARKRLDETKRLQLKRKEGAATGTEWREYCVEQRDEFQRLIDCFDAGDTPSQEEQQRLYRDIEEGGDRRQEQPIREAIGHVVDEPLALEGGFEPAPEPERPPATPAPEPTRQPSNRPITGPLSTKQKWAAEERRRRGGDGKNPFA